MVTVRRSYEGFEQYLESSEQLSDEMLLEIVAGAIHLMGPTRGYKWYVRFQR